MIGAGDLTKQSEAGRGRKAREEGGGEIQCSLCISLQKTARNYNYPPCFAAQNKSGIAPNPAQAAIVIRKYSTPWRTEEPRA